MDPAVLTTMVILYTMDIKVDTIKILETLPLTADLIKIEKQGSPIRGSSKKNLIKRRVKETPVAPKRTTGFGHNSITLVVLNDGDGHLLRKEITVKIFQNGVFHITGVLDERYDRSVMNFLQAHITANCKECIVSGTWELKQRRVVLMNYKTRLHKVANLSRETLYAYLRSKGVKTEYEPSVYPAVKIYFAETRWIAKVFRTGNIILTGMTSNDECVRLMSALNPLIQSIPSEYNAAATRA
jgi:TATA-box binding protein (TBP) (component of TFIID and TFIIIB)